MKFYKNWMSWTSLLIIDPATTLDISGNGKLSGISKIYGDSSLGVSLVTSAVKMPFLLREQKEVAILLTI